MIEDNWKILKAEIAKIDTVGLLKTTNVVSKFTSFMLGVIFIYAGITEMIIFGSVIFPKNIQRLATRKIF